MRPGGLLFGISPRDLKKLSPFKDATCDDKWDQVNRCYVFISMIIMGGLATMRQYSGDVINCDGFTKFKDSFVEDYCWSMGLYTVKEAYDLPSEMVPYPGVLPLEMPSCLPGWLRNGTYFECVGEDLVMPATKIFHLWYQWTPFWFLGVAIAYYTPYMLFKQLGGDEYKPLIKLMATAELVKEGNPVDVKEKVVNWLYFKFKSFLFTKGPSNWWQKNRFSVVLGVTKLVYLGITVSTFYFTGLIFEYGSWYTYGAEFYGVRMSLYEDTADGTIIKDILFPKLVSCEVMRWGPTGLETETAQCVLAPNVLYQYLFLFSWFILVTAFFSNLISCLMHLSEMFFVNGTYTRMLQDNTMKDKQSYRYVFMNIGAGGREIIQIITDNSDAVLFTKIFNELVERLIKSSTDHLVIANVAFSEVNGETVN